MAHSMTNGQVTDGIRRPELMIEHNLDVSTNRTQKQRRPLSTARQLHHDRCRR